MAWGGLTNLDKDPLVVIKCFITNERQWQMILGGGTDNNYQKQAVDFLTQSLEVVIEQLWQKQLLSRRMSEKEIKIWADLEKVTKRGYTVSQLKRAIHYHYFSNK